jgi:hypothetical protein
MIIDVIIEMSSKRGTTDLRMLITKDGEKDKRCNLMNTNRKKIK